MKCFRSVLMAAVAAVFVSSGIVFAQTPFELKDGDRVVWIGSEFTEQATKHNFVEATLTARWPERRITFRNLGWAGDNPTAVARGYFNGAEEGYRRLQEELTRLKPTVIFLEYGETSAYDGEAGIPAFKEQMQKLIADLRKLTDRIILVSPPPAEKLAAPLPDPQQINQNRAAYAAVLKEIAEKEKLQYIDIFTPLQRALSEAGGDHLTTDTLRYNREGYAAAAHATLGALLVSGFAGPDSQEELRELIRLKNDLYFHQYRPQNETYLRGFRKHEQGQNAKDIAAFEPLIEAAEERIADYVQGKSVPVTAPTLPPRELDFKALTPQEQQAQFKIAEGLEIAPFASEPMVKNPIHMNFDGKGRLWVATSPIYPQIRPGAQPSDEIIILEDTDGDHVADKCTVFADDLLIPTAVLPDEQGGAYVANSTELLHLMDRDGDGRADERRVLLSGFGTEDTHHILHTFRWSPDALLSFNQSIYIHSHLETPYGVKTMLGSGIWRYRPETARANTVAFGMVNPWGLIFDRWGQSQSTDGAGGEGIYYVFPGAAYQTAVGFDRIMPGLNPGQPKFCGLEIINGRHFSDEYQDTLVAADFRGNRLCRFRLSEEGSGYVSRQLDDLLSCEDRAFRPVDEKMGPDGALYIADWHNPIINHGEVDFRDPRRDDRHGRIWRITEKGRETPARPNFSDATVDQLVELLKSPETWTRHLARVYLRHKDPEDVAKALGKWLAGIKPDDPQFEQLRLEGLWTYQSQGSVPQEFLLAILKSSDHHARAAAVRVLSQSTYENYGLPADFDALSLLQEAVKDSHPQVRLEAVNALRQIPDAKSAALALAVLDQPMDSWLDFALWSTIRTLEPVWGPQVIAGTAAFSSEPAKLLFALKSTEQAKFTPVLMDLLTSGKVPADQKGAVLGMIGKYARAGEARVLFDRAVSTPEERDSLLGALITLSEKRQITPAEDLSAIETLFDNPQAVVLAGLWKLEKLQPRLIALAEDATAPLPQRFAAIRGLISMNSRETLEKLAADPATSFAVRQRAVAGIQSLDTAAGAALAVKLLAAATPDDEAELNAFLDSILAPKDGPDQLAKALQGTQLPEAVTTTVLRKASSAGARGEKLKGALNGGAGMPAAAPKMTPEEIAELLARVKTHGNAANGEVLYRRKDLACLSCHSIGGAGGQAGPDMLSLGASSPVDYILESLLNPSAKIKEGYHTNTIALEDGKIVSGIMVREGDTEIVIRDAQNKEIAIPKDEIDERATSPTSLMPADLTAKLNRNELLDLVVFLSSLGKEGPYKVPQNRFIRRWLTEDQNVVLSRVNGSLPMSDLPGGKVAFEVEVSTPGKIGLKVHDPAGLKLTRPGLDQTWQGEVVEVDLPAGRQRFEVEIPAGRLSPLQVEVIDIADAAGRAEPANR
ncbi:PVC-type heme-binding CxxCH protein [Planctomicrobium sp. SH661]|uniref:PVC-type heme-binding CxxCH protein n=1 Tax=Planctomicrobium sp. SH661 TaxID=3448124 RepID=UPI003F5C2D61